MGVLGAEEEESPEGGLLRAAKPRRTGVFRAGQGPGQGTFRTGQRGQPPEREW